jgi:hypothetical protein
MTWTCFPHTTRPPIMTSAVTATLPRSAERIGVALQTLKANLAIARGIMLSRRRTSMSFGGMKASDRAMDFYSVAVFVRATVTKGVPPRR